MSNIATGCNLRDILNTISSTRKIHRRKTSPYRRPDDDAKDDSRRKTRKPMDGHGNAETDVKGVEQGRSAKPFFWFFVEVSGW